METVDRYLKAVRFWLPKTQKDDIAAELAEDIRSQIADQEEELGRELRQPEIEAILERFGSPIVVAGRYLPEQRLIGPTLFPLYRVALLAVFWGYLVPWIAVWIGLLIFWPAYRAEHLGIAMLGDLWAWTKIAIFAFAVVTVAFAVADSNQQKLGVLDGWSPRSLPPERDPRRISRVSAFAELATVVVMLAWWASLPVAPQTYELGDGVTWTAGPVWQTFHGTLYLPILAVLVLSIAMACVKLLHPRCTRRRLGARALLSGVECALVAGTLAVHARRVGTQWNAVTDSTAELSKVELVAGWTDVSVFIALLVVAVLCACTCGVELRRFLRWESRSEDARTGSAVIAVALALAALHDQARAQARSESADSSAIASDAEIREVLARRVEIERRATGIVVGIVEPAGRRLVAHGRDGTSRERAVDGDTIFEIGSVTKVFTSLALADMVQKNEVALSDPVEELLPDDVAMPRWNDREIQLVDLATQTSGLPFWPMNFPDVEDVTGYARYTVDELYEALSTHELLHDVGVHWEYSNLGVGLLGHALARRAGTDYASLIRARITEPLGMESTGISFPPETRSRLAQGHASGLEPAPEWIVPALEGAGSLRSSANDLLQFLESFLGEKETPMREAMDAMLETRRPAADWLQYLGGEQALGWWVIDKDDDTILLHAGQTFGSSSSVGWNPHTRTGVVALANGAHGAEDIALHLLKPSIPLSAPPIADERTEATVDPAVFDHFAGKYAISDHVILVVERRGDTLRFLGPGGPMIRLRAIDERTYFIPNTAMEVECAAPDPDLSPSLTLKLGGYPIQATRVNDPNARHSSK